jgi:hypothetical protein
MDDVHAALPELSLHESSSSVSFWLAHRDEIIVDAPYQRSSVWTLDQRRGLVKSLLMGLPVPSPILSLVDPRAEQHLRVVDGRQRIETVWAFFEDQFTIPGHWVGQDGDLLYSQLPDRARSRLRRDARMGYIEADLRSVYARDVDGLVVRDESGVAVVSRLGDDELLAAEAELFLLVNTSGTAQTDEDLARARAVAGL